MTECEENNLSYNGIGNRFRRSASMTEKSCSKSNGKNDEQNQIYDEKEVCVDANGTIRLEDEVWEHQNQDKCARCFCKVRHKTFLQHVILLI